MCACMQITKSRKKKNREEYFTLFHNFPATDGQWLTADAITADVIETFKKVWCHQPITMGQFLVNLNLLRSHRTLIYNCVDNRGRRKRRPPLQLVSVGEVMDAPEGLAIKAGAAT